MAKLRKIHLMQERVQHGVMPELVELARIQGVKGYRARQLFNAGIRTIKEVAESDPVVLEAIFNKGGLTNTCCVCFCFNCTFPSAFYSCLDHKSIMASRLISRIGTVY